MRLPHSPPPATQSFVSCPCSCCCWVQHCKRALLFACRRQVRTACAPRGTLSPPPPVRCCLPRRCGRACAHPPTPRSLAPVLTLAPSFPLLLEQEATMKSALFVSSLLMGAQAFTPTLPLNNAFVQRQAARAEPARATRGRGGESVYGCGWAGCIVKSKDIRPRGTTKASREARTKTRTPHHHHPPALALPAPLSCSAQGKRTRIHTNPPPHQPPSHSPPHPSFFGTKSKAPQPCPSHTQTSTRAPLTSASTTTLTHPPPFPLPQGGFGPLTSTLPQSNRNMPSPASSLPLAKKEKETQSTHLSHPPLLTLPSLPPSLSQTWT